MGDSDCILIMGSNHCRKPSHFPAFKWVLRHQDKGGAGRSASLDPALHPLFEQADTCVSFVGTDIAFLGGMINYILNATTKYFKRCVIDGTNGPGRRRAVRVQRRPLLRL